MSRILVIDDDKFVRTSIRAVIEGVGHEVSDASDAEVGLSLQRANPFDVAIVDLIMPNKEGLETIRELKRDFPRLAIIAISGGGDIVRKNFFQAAQLFGADYTLEKPFDGGDLLATLEKALGGAASSTKGVASAGS
ncbi:MAG: response regulator [Rhodospirillales bacterium]|nr:response regulator [Rhodospirillales bacterium]